MKGIDLTTLHQELLHVSPEHNEQPVLAIEGVTEKLAYSHKWQRLQFGEFSFLKHYHSLPLVTLRNFSFDDICKMKYSSTFMMDDSVRKQFEEDENSETVRKITSSMWRWGFSKGTWNEVVDAYNCIKRFSFGINDDFTVRLDYTTGYNEQGYTKFSRTFIDGVLAFLVYYKEQHVMTIGFSITHSKRILIQQVQLVQQCGNRWLYKIPANRLDYCIGLFRKYFPRYQLYIADGSELVQKTLSSYESLLTRTLKWIDEDLCSLTKPISDPEETREYYTLSLARHVEDKAEVEKRIEHLQQDAPRLLSFYGNTGSFRKTTRLKVNGQLHYRLRKTRSRNAKVVQLTLSA